MRALLVLLAAAASLSAAAAAHADRGLIVGVSDDRLKWQSRSWATVAVMRDLGLDAVRITFAWQPGRPPARYDVDGLRRTVTAANGMRVVVSVFGKAADAPRDERSRAEYCGLVARLLRALPSVNDVVIWNEVNIRAFWGGTAADYGELLADCWDAAHAVRPQANLLTSTAASHDPGGFVKALAAWYRASGRTRPLFDTIGHHPYPASPSEAPGARHASGRIGIGDLGRLLAAYAPFGKPKVWYMETGWEGDDGSKLAAALRLAACQPRVGAFFNFMLVDEDDPRGWQSGLFDARGYPKPAYGRFRAAIADVRRGDLDCE